MAADLSDFGIPPGGGDILSPLPEVDQAISQFRAQLRANDVLAALRGATPDEVAAALTAAVEQLRG